jgi:hypothetical protein
MMNPDLATTVEDLECWLMLPVVIDAIADYRAGCSFKDAPDGPFLRELQGRRLVPRSVRLRLQLLRRQLDRQTRQRRMRCGTASPRIPALCKESANHQTDPLPVFAPYSSV